jgi:hypothetical protein
MLVIVVVVTIGSAAFGESLMHRTRLPVDLLLLPVPHPSLETLREYPEVEYICDRLQ